MKIECSAREGHLIEAAVRLYRIEVENRIRKSKSNTPARRLMDELTMLLERIGFKEAV